MLLLLQQVPVPFLQCTLLFDAYDRNVRALARARILLPQELPVVKPFDSPLGIGGISNFAVSIPSDSSITISSPREFSALEHGTTGILLGVGMVFLMVVRKTWFKDFGT